MENEASELRNESITEKELNILAKSSNEIMAQVSDLEKRLQSILRGESAKDSPLGASTPEESYSLVPSEIRTHRKLIESASRNLRSITNRLEI